MILYSREIGLVTFAVVVNAEGIVAVLTEQLSDTKHFVDVDLIGTVTCVHFGTTRVSGLNVEEVATGTHTQGEYFHAEIINTCVHTETNQFGRAQGTGIGIAVGTVVEADAVVVTLTTTEVQRAPQNAIQCTVRQNVIHILSTSVATNTEDIGTKVDRFSLATNRNLSCLCVTVDGGQRCNRFDIEDVITTTTFDPCGGRPIGAFDGQRVVALTEEKINCFSLAVVHAITIGHI